MVARARSADDDQLLCKDVSKEELTNILKLLISRRTPAIDGIPYEFYIKFYNLLADDVVRLLNYFKNRHRHNLFAEGIHILIPKVKNANYLEKFRPITLLNTDYKMLKKVIARKMQTITNKLIAIEQSCKANGSIINNLVIIRDLIIEVEYATKPTAAVLRIDIQRAFDTISKDYIWKVIRKMKFSETFIEMIAGVYTLANSKIIINGFLSSGFAIKAGVRQGCPLSFILFSIAI